METVILAANSRIRKVEKPRMVFAEADAPGGILTKSGKRITAKVVVPDGMMGYGDKESLAAMTADTVARGSTDSTAGDKAYESAREQYEQDHEVRAKKLKNMEVYSKNPALKMWYDKGSGTWDIHYLEEDEATGILTPRSKKLTDAQTGYMYQQYQEAQIAKTIQKDE